MPRWSLADWADLVDLELGGQVAIVTGGASNIGRAISQGLAGEGAVVAIVDRDLAMAERTAAEIAAAGGTAIVFGADLTDRSSVQAVVSAIETDIGPVAVLVNNVGWNGRARFFLDTDPDAWTASFELNLKTTLTATHVVLPAMVQRRAGVVVSIASDAAFGELRMSDYGSMKAGVLAFSRTIAREYGRFGIRSNAVCPGLVIPEADAIGAGSLWQQEVGFGEREIANVEQSIPLRRRPVADDIAWTVAFLASTKAQMLTGQVVSVSGGFAMPR